MEIGSEISEKIQLAIKAKLVEINAYVDDELPDYIMIMIANRKPEEQMSDALSLFLGTNAASFTKWLYELLCSLRKKSGDKTNSEAATSHKIEPKTQIVDNTVEKITPKETSPDLKPEPPSKISRWDVKKPLKRKSVTEERSVKENVDNKYANTYKEAVIDILPEVDDLFDAELMGDVKESPNKSSQKTTSKSKTVKVTTKSGIKPITFDKEDDKSLGTSARKSLPIKSSEKRQKTDNDVIKTSRQPSSTSERSPGNKKDTSSSLSKRSVAVKSSKDSVRKVSTTDKEFSNQFAPSKSKKKKLKRSRSEKEHITSSKEKDKSSQKQVREWDRAKGREPLTYDNDPPTRRPSHSEKTEKVSVKSRISQVSSTVSIAKDPQYESEDSDASPVRSSVISKVAVPQRRSRLPPSKQANRSLLLKAVSEAESSIKQFLTNKSVEPVSEATFKSRVEKHKRTAFGIVLERNRTQDQDGLGKHVSSRLLRDSKLLGPSPEDRKKDKIVIRKLPQKRKGQGDVTGDKVDKVPSQTSQQFGDSRRIVPRGQNESVESKKLIRRTTDVENVVVSRDTRKLSLQDSAIDSETMVEKENSNNGKSKHESVDVDKPEKQDKPIKKQRKRRASSPCFIVTLDGSSATKKEEPSTQKDHSTSETTDKLKTASENKPETVSTNRTKPTDAASQKPAASEKSKSFGDEAALSERELENMREKLLAMQEKAKKLKEIQSKRQEMLQQKLNNGQSASNSSDKLIHIANVHYSATESQLFDHFSICGKVAKVTILKDSFTGQPKGFAYLEFEEVKAVEVALALDGTSFCGRNINISRKPNELATASPSASKRFYSAKRYSNPRQFIRYNTRVSSHTWTRTPVTRNKTWVKPGYAQS